MRSCRATTRRRVHRATGSCSEPFRSRTTRPGSAYAPSDEPARDTRRTSVWRSRSRLSDEAHDLLAPSEPCPRGQRRCRRGPETVPQRFVTEEPIEAGRDALRVGRNEPRVDVMSHFFANGREVAGQDAGAIGEVLDELDR